MFWDDAVQLTEAIGKKVEISTIDNTFYEGYIHTIDPYTKTTILRNKTDSNILNLFVITFSSIKSFQIQPGNEESLILPKDTDVDKSCDNIKRKKLLKGWLKHNLIEVDEVGDSLKYQDYLVIEPPFDINHCYCSNTIVLDRIRNVIKKMPDDFKCDED